MVIRVGNVYSHIVSGYADTKLVDDYLRVEHPDIENVVSDKWDGVYRYCYRGKFLTGLIPLIDSIFKPTYQDVRANYMLPKVVPTMVGEFNLMDYKGSSYQYDCAVKCSYHNVNQIYFPRGIVNAATNAGKNSIITAIAKTFEVKTIFLIYDKDVFDQSKKFFSKFFEIGEISAEVIDIKPFTICMPKSLLNRSKREDVKNFLNTAPLLIVDESHRAAGSDYSKLLRSINSFARFFFSGTSLDRPINENLTMIGMSGPKLVEITNKFLISIGVSMPVQVNMYKNIYTGYTFSYKDEVEKVIIFNTYRNNIIFNKAMDGKQTFISVRNIKHGKHLETLLSATGLNVIFVAGKSAYRKDVIDDLKSGYIDIVISTVFRVGLNIPTLKRWINGHGGKSVIELKQIAGRILRNDGSGDTMEFVDFYDYSDRLESHSKDRLNLYKSEEFNITIHEEKVRIAN